MIKGRDAHFNAADVDPDRNYAPPGDQGGGWGGEEKKLGTDTDKNDREGGKETAELQGNFELQL